MSGRPQRLDVLVGAPVHLSQREARDLEGLAHDMRQASYHRSPGWLARYVKAWNRAGKIVGRAIERSQREARPVPPEELPDAGN